MYNIAVDFGSERKEGRRNWNTLVNGNSQGGSYVNEKTRTKTELVIEMVFNSHEIRSVSQRY